MLFGSRSPFPAAFDLNQLNGTNGFTIYGVGAGGAIGYVVSTAGDINNDNISDLVFGASGTNSDLGAGYVIFGSRSPFPASFNLTQLNGANGFTIPGVVPNGQLGWSVSTAGDVNGDSITDLMLGAYSAYSAVGASYVIFGSQNLFPPSFNLNQLNGTNGFTIPGVSGTKFLGFSVSFAGDINNDNISDLVFGATGTNSDLGAGYVIFGSRSPFPASFNLTQLNGANGFTIPGVVPNGQLGWSVSTAGDVNGDNITDLVLGARTANGNLGCSYVLFGSQKSFPASFNLAQLNGANGFIIPGVIPSGQLGYSVGTAGDINGDSITDLLLGSPTANSSLGVSYVIFGSRKPFPASFDLNLFNGNDNFVIPGIAPFGHLGASFGTAGDLNGDNISDLVVGAVGANSLLGASYVIFGKNTSASIPAPTSPNSFPLTPCPITQPLTLKNNAIRINQAQTLRVTPNDLSAGCGTIPTPNLQTLFNITGINHAQFKTRNSSGIWNNASSFLGNDLSQGNVELIQNNGTLTPQINFTVTDGQTTLPETPANIRFNISETTPVINAINIDIQKNGTTTLTPQHFQISGVGTQLDNLVITVTSIEAGHFAVENILAPITDFTYYQVRDEQIQFVHNGTTLPNMTLTVGDGSAAPVSFSPLVHFFSADNPGSPSLPVEAIVGSAVGAVAVTAAVGMTALGVIKYRDQQKGEEDLNYVKWGLLTRQNEGLV